MRYKLFILCIILTSKVSGQQIAQRTSISCVKEMNYLLYAPKEMSAEQKYPLLLFLHGGGEAGDSIELLKTHGPPKLIAQGKDYPFYVLSPQSPYINSPFDDYMIERLLNQVVDSLNIDTSRIYLAGLSRGGYGVWRLAIINPDRYAAMISICPASVPMVYIDKLTDLPIWLFHGEKDPAVPVEFSIDAYNELKSLDGNVRLSLYPEADHDSWTQTFENDSIYTWLLSHSKNDR